MGSDAEGEQLGRPRSLVERAVEVDLFGPEGLLGEDEVSAPAKYELIRKLGSGGSGVVWLARDMVLDRLAALKFLGDVPASVFERFRREARFAARLESPSIVRVYELDEHEGRPYIAMEYVDGGNLEDAHLEDRDLIRVMREVCVALQHAHSNGIVHRDIKPGNILLDRGQRAFLTDFGIARDLTGQRGMTLSSIGQVMGTPACMPPEQARGDLHAVDGRSDVYAVGATLFYKLTGRWPFEGDNVVDLLHAVIHDPPPFPRSFRPEVPRGLEAIVVKCLQKQRSARFASMTELIEEFDRYLDGAPVQTESSWFRRLVGRGGAAATEAKTASSSEVGTDPFWTLGMEVARELAAWDADAYRISRNVPRTFPALDRIIARLGVFLTQRPDAAWARFYRGMALFRRGRGPEALEEMEHAIDRVGHLGGAYFELGRLYLGEHLRAQEQARGHVSRVGVAEHLHTTRRGLHQAALALGEARRINRDLAPWQVHYADAVARMADEDYAACVAECDRILADDPDAEEVWKLRGDALRLAGEEPFESYERALSIRRGFYEVCLAEARCRLERGQWDGARRALEHALLIHPELTEAEVLLARLELARIRAASEEAGVSERLARGLELAERATTRDPRHYEGTLTRAELLLETARRSGDAAALDRAEHALDDARGLEGCQNRVQVLFARCLIARGVCEAAAGRDPRPPLQRALALSEEAMASIAESEAWRELASEAEHVLGRLTST